jgi:ketosteroid isomerase-like protein
MTAEEVLRVHRNIFYRSLINQDFEALADLYANEYMLVRPDGSVLNKEVVLDDLTLGGLTFKSIDLVGEDVRMYGETAILTGESRTLACRNGEELSSRFRLVAVYTRDAEEFKLIHFQSTPLSAERSVAS